MPNPVIRRRLVVKKEVVLINAPINLIGNLVTGDIQLDWTDTSDNEDSFAIERSVDGGAFSFYTTVGANIETYTDTSVSFGSTYCYRIRAFSALVGFSKYSNTICIFVPGSGPTAYSSGYSSGYK
jgi:hypothetical protein